MKPFVFIPIIFYASLSIGQDTTVVLSYTNYRELIAQNHPIAKQAKLIKKQAYKRVMAAKGNFDPVVFHESDKKSFDGKSYYFHSQSGIQFTIWPGVELKGMYELANGTYLNPESNFPATGLQTLGVSVNVLQGLLFDQRRAEVKQAKVFAQMAEIEQQKMLIYLFQKSWEVYWKWSLYEQKFTVYEQGLNLAQQRFEAVKVSYFQGDVSAFDTLEAFSQVQLRKNQLIETNRDLVKAKAEAGNYLWSDDDLPILIPNNLIPEKLPLNEYPFSKIDTVTYVLAQTVFAQPDIAYLNLKLKSEQINQRLKAEYLKPKLKVNYNFLQAGIGVYNPLENPLIENNYKWGISLAYPILNRSALGEFQISKIKQESLMQGLKQTTLQISNKASALLSEINLANNQLELNKSFIENQQSLVFGEQQRFENGESSLFLINVREQALLNYQVKQWQLAFERKVLEANLLSTIGLLVGE